ncbi:DUF2326 domain-containing protein [Clostridium sp. BNL1100]|uniref:DUF2326 domain-containing protein n=1 Tax=Clostridium sp. BNL1100 TaxID=755731 RepID=UPI00024A7B88|nr:DUF2326 domain-containing protein [Clostridium sp. BNL1100]AEY65746.1 hypothetical protein Clo1100_1516 [Clostridium sp. BNL1100]
MLKKIYCEKFLQKEVEFHSGLNAVVGDDVASNSIGKSTMLMIIDFVFGGEDYIKKNHDTVDQLGHHEFRFIFEFLGKEYFFIRSTSEYKSVSTCNEKFEIINTDKVEKFTAWLQEQFMCQLEDLSFRNIVGRYFRIYGKENLNERKPIQYFEKESAAMSISALLKLFDKYKALKVFEVQIEALKSEKTTLVDAAKKDLIPHVVTKTLFGKNEKKIIELTQQLELLKKDIVTASTDIEALVSKEILKLRREKSALVTKKNGLESRLIRTQTNLKNRNVNIQIELNQFVHYFPNFNIERVREVDGFHKTITQILKSELQAAEKDLKTEMAEIEKQILSIDKEIEEKLSIKNAPKFAVDKVVELVAEIKQLNDENGYYKKKKSIEENITSAVDNLDILKEKVLDEICNQINVKMYELNKEIYTDGRRPPTLNIHGNKYTFNTYGDTGTGTAFANLISFDLALLELTCLPAVAHDLPLLKNIENLALENIIELYSIKDKQIFIAIDKLNSYSKTAADTIEKYKVLKLSKDKVLFIKNWKKAE